MLAASHIYLSVQPTSRSLPLVFIAIVVPAHSYKSSWKATQMYFLTVVPLTTTAPSKQGFTHKAAKSVRFKPKWKNQRYHIHVITKQAKKSRKAQMEEFDNIN